MRKFETHTPAPSHWKLTDAIVFARPATKPNAVHGWRTSNRPNLKHEASPQAN
jgi:hypothetical protein